MFRNSLACSSTSSADLDKGVAAFPGEFQSLVRAGGRILEERNSRFSLFSQRVFTELDLYAVFECPLPGLGQRNHGIGIEAQIAPAAVHNDPLDPRLPAAVGLTHR